MTELIARVAQRPNFAALAVGLVLIPLILLGNFAVALLVGCAVGIALDRAPVAGASQIGKLALQAGIVLLSFRMDLGQLGSIGAHYLLWIVVFVTVTLLSGVALMRLLRLERALGLLLAAGTAICGGTAIACLGPTVRARSEQIAIALAIVFLLNTVALLTFPMVGRWLGLSQEAFGVWSALAIHDTASVVGTAAQYGDESLVVATAVKLGRMLCLVPVALVFAFVCREQAENAAKRPAIPRFILLFLAGVALSSVVQLPTVLMTTTSSLSHALLVVAVFFIGTELRRTTLVKVRGRALIFALSLWIGVVGTTLAAVTLLV